MHAYKKHRLTWEMDRLIKNLSKCPYTKITVPHQHLTSYVRMLEKTSINQVLKLKLIQS